jgi:PAP2 superfamily
MREAKTRSLAAHLGALVLLTGCLRAEQGAHQLRNDSLPAAPPSAVTAGISPVDREYLLNFPRGVWEMIKRPFDLSTDALIADAVVVGGTGLLLLADEPIQDFFQDNRSDASDQMSDVVRPMGDFPVLMGSLGAVYLAGEVADDRRLQRAGLLGLQSVLLSGLPVIALKLLTGRDRPDQSRGSDSFGGPGSDGRSFPSGHAASAFAAATIFAEEYEDTSWVPPVAYGLATLVALSRINDDEHWASDVFVGAAIGYGVGKLVMAMDPFDPNRRAVILPLAYPNAVGAEVRIAF